MELVGHVTPARRWATAKVVLPDPAGWGRLDDPPGVRLAPRSVLSRTSFCELPKCCRASPPRHTRGRWRRPPLRLLLARAGVGLGREHAAPRETPSLLTRISFCCVMLRPLMDRERPTAVHGVAWDTSRRNAASARSRSARGRPPPGSSRTGNSGLCRSHPHPRRSEEPRERQGRSHRPGHRLAPEPSHRPRRRVSTPRPLPQPASSVRAVCPVSTPGRGAGQRPLPGRVAPGQRRDQRHRRRREGYGTYRSFRIRPSTWTSSGTREKPCRNRADPRAGARPAPRACERVNGTWPRCCRQPLTSRNEGRPLRGPSPPSRRCPGESGPLRGTPPARRRHPFSPR